jgi:WbqC-like protein family
LEEAYQKEHALLVDLNVHLIELILHYLNYEGETHLSTDFDTNVGKTERLINLLKQTGGTCYLSGKSGRAYLEGIISARKYRDRLSRFHSSSV